MGQGQRHRRGLCRRCLPSCGAGDPPAGDGDAVPLCQDHGPAAGEGERPGSGRIPGRGYHPNLESGGCPMGRAERPVVLRQRHGAAGGGERLLGGAGRSDPAAVPGRDARGCLVCGAGGADDGAAAMHYHRRGCGTAKCGGGDLLLWGGLRSLSAGERRLVSDEQGNGHHRHCL